MFFNNLIIRNTIEKFINERFIENKDKKINLKDIDTLYVAFNDFTITLPLIIRSYDAKLNKHSSDWIEILPSIYCLKTKEYFYIFNRNVRDTFYVLDKTYSDQFIPNSICCKIENVNIDPEILPYPTMLGGGCPIWTDFEQTLFHKTTVHYSILKYDDILEVTAHDGRFKEIYCEEIYTGKNCYDRFLEKLLNGTFTFETNNKIEITRYRECFYLEEGKHRICAFKRYKRSDKIIADITYLKCNYHSYPDENMKYDKRYNSLPEEILEDYYEAYKKIGIEKKEATCITENIKNENFIEYFEGKYGKDIFQIMNDLKK